MSFRTDESLTKFKDHKSLNWAETEIQILFEYKKKKAQRSKLH